MTLVHGDGNRTARILFLGEAPAATEVRLGKPFQGRAGEQLDELLHDAGIKRADCYFTNSSLRPVTGDKAKFFFERRGKPTPTLLEGMVALAKDIQEINPCVVVPLGNFALWTMMPEIVKWNKQGPSGIMNWRGSVLWSDLWNVKVMPTLHPAALLHGQSLEPGGTSGGGGMWKLRSVVVWDLEKAKKESERHELVRTKRTILVDPQGEDEHVAIDRLLKADEVTFDCETFGGTNLACIGFGDSSDPNWASVWSYGGGLRKPLFKHLLERGVPLVGQNLMYDSTLLDQLGINVKNVKYDTMYAAHTLYPEFPKRLDFMTSVYTDIPFYKEEGKVWNQQPTGQKLLMYFTYCGKDVCGTTEVKQNQTVELTERKLWPVMNRRMGAFQPCREATFDGLKVDIPLLKQFGNEMLVIWNEAQAKLDTLAGKSVNVYSTPQVKKLVYEDWKLPPRYKKKKLTTDERALMDIVAKTEDPRLGYIIICRKARKMRSNVYNEKNLSADGRWRYNFNIVGTRFGRFSSDAPLWGPGLNIQNIPIRDSGLGARSRQIVIADDGMEFWELDQSQAEAVIVAYLADDPVHMDCFRTGKDVHRVTACLLIDMDPSAWQTIGKDDQIREIAKRANHALNYMEGWATFMTTVNMEYDPTDPESLRLDASTAKGIHTKYLQIRPALNNYWDGIKRELRENQRTLVSPLGLPYTFLDQWSDSLLRAAVSFKPQSTVGETTNIALARIYNDDDMRRMNVKFKTQTHDSVLLQAPVEYRDEVLKRIWPLVETELFINGYRIVVPWEAKVGKTWYKRGMETLGMSRKTCEIGYED